MGIVSATADIFTFACNFIDIKSGERKCFYTTPWNYIIFAPCKSWEDFKKEQKARGGFKAPLQNRIREENAVMKNNKNAKIFDFSTLQFFQLYDRYTEKILSDLISIQPDIVPIIRLIKMSSMNITEKTAIIFSQLKIAFRLYYSYDKLAYFAERIANYLFDETNEYKYRKQFAE